MLRTANLKPIQGFTLVELLVVIAIILMLVALLVPTLQRVKETAKNAKCISNLRQVAMTTFVYAADYNGFAPWGENNLVVSSSSFTRWSRDSSDTKYYKSWYPKNKWFAEYFSGGQLGKMNVAGYCPKGGRLGEIGPSTPEGYDNVSYALNADLGEEWWLDNNSADKCSVPLAQVKTPGKVSLWVEANKNKLWPKGESVSGRHFSKEKKVASEPGPTIGKYTVWQNLGRANVVFVDGHLSSFKVPDEVPEWSCYFWHMVKDDKIGKCKTGTCKACNAGIFY
jgi:prepilin-type N-terminal cleavage/methylation domain-containing protein/prepilin-type processing-associated H-X9-DG protein